MTDTPSPTDTLRMALACIRWHQFGECRTTGWNGPPPQSAETVAALEAALAASAPVPTVTDDYGHTNHFCFAGVQMSEGAKRLGSLLAKALGPRHPALEDFAGLVLSAVTPAAPVAPRHFESEDDRRAAIWEHYVGPVERDCPERKTCEGQSGCFCKRKDAALSAAPSAVPAGWTFKRNTDGSVGIFAPPPRPGESQRTSHAVYASQSRDLHELLGKLADHQAAVPAQPEPVAQGGERFVPTGSCTCAGPDGPCEGCIANREAYEEWKADRTTPTNQAATPPAVNVDALAQFIRTINGDNRMGAGALAEHICQFLSTTPGAQHG